MTSTQERCQDPVTNIKAVQEHCLTSNGLMALNNIHPDFSAFGISAMNYRLTTGVYRGRPFGGVAFMWLFVLSVMTRPLFIVYFSCFSSGLDYANELGLH